MNSPRRTLVAVFPSRQVLISAVDHLANADSLSIERTAVVAKAIDGETVVVDNHINPNEAGIAGGTLGAAVGVLGMTQLGALLIPGVGPIVSIGAGVLFGGFLGRKTGRLAVHMMNPGFNQDQIEGLAKHLKDGEAALLVAVETEQALSKVQHELSTFTEVRLERLDNLIEASTS
jgi:uncharacterized membrane protein